MHVSSSDHCERTILSTVSVFAKGSDQWRVSPWQCWKLAKLEFVRHLRPCAGRLFCCWCCATGFQESYCYQLPWITLPVPVPSKKEHEWAEHWTTFAMLKEQTLVLGSSSLSRQSCNWMGLPAPIHIKHQYRTENAHACAKHDHCERTILSTVSILAKESDQWSVSLWQCWKLTKLEFVRHLRPCAGRLFCCWCWGSQESYCYQLPWITLPVRVPSKKEHEWAEHWTTFAMLKEQTLVLGSSSLSRQSWQLNGPSCTNSHQTPVITEQRTHMHVPSMTTAREPSSSEIPFSHRVRSMKSVSTRNRAAIQFMLITHTEERAVTIVRKSFPSEISFSQKVGSMKSISFAMLKAEKAWAWQTPQALCWGES